MRENLKPEKVFRVQEILNFCFEEFLIKRNFSGLRIFDFINYLR